MDNFLTYFQIFISLCLIGAILLQTPGGGLGTVFGGGGQSYRSKRGVEKFVFYLTIFLSILFLVSSVLNLVV